MSQGESSYSCIIDKSQNSEEEKRVRGREGGIKGIIINLSIRKKTCLNFLLKKMKLVNWRKKRKEKGKKKKKPCS